MHPQTTTRPRPARAAHPAAVPVLALATFTVVTGEMLPVGLLSPLAADLGRSEGTAGLAVTLPGIVAALAAPLLPPAARRTDRRTLLTALLVLLAAANLLSALATSLPALLAARVLVGVCIGGVWAVAAGLAPRLVPAARTGRATALIFSGIAVASVVGVPAGTYLGELTGWRWSFAAVGALSLTAAALLRAALPPLPAETAVRPAALLALLGAPRVRQGLLAVLFLVTGHFAAYTYVRPLLARVPHLGAATVSALLLAYGVAGIAGNFLGGALAARRPRPTLTAIAAALAATVLLLIPAVGSLTASAALLLAWGLAYGGVSVAAQNWLAAAAPAAREAVSGLFAGAFNCAIALGALAGGLVVDGLGVTPVLWLAGALTAAACVTGAATERTGDRP
ncbi:MFS transporter [Streptomyces xanthii]|uniref:MFS transporter n=1 Tax=Streptomyces xanthii TaxID=2768069 RepID=A0A7H1BBY3_9ACTN|nr:MFS transporter [Streptomyces xanthii]QNS06238.1 MFS transporter [Streptomyces xanthii]